MTPRTSGLAAILFAVLAPVSANADLYIGLGGSAGTGQLEESANGLQTASVDHDNTATQVKFGLVGARNNRIELSFSSIELEYEGGGTDELTGIDLDGVLTLGTGSSVPFIGLGLGFYSFEDTAASFAENEDLRGLALNFALGGIIGLGRNFEIELAYKYKYINWEDIVSTSFVVVEPESSISSIYLGANLRF